MTRTRSIPPLRVVVLAATAALLLPTATVTAAAHEHQNVRGSAQLVPHERAWGRTAEVNVFSVGQCTWGAAQKFGEASGVFPWIDGDARHWPSSAAQNGWTTVEHAEARAIVIFQPGVHGAAATGHAGWVESVSDSPEGRRVHLTETNADGRADGTWSSRTVLDAPGMSYILAP